MDNPSATLLLGEHTKWRADDTGSAAPFIARPWYSTIFPLSTILYAADSAPLRHSLC